MTTSHITNSHRESTGSHFLPGSAYAVLGLLSFGAELSGYELRQLALNSLRFFYWTPAQSQIYRELRRLSGLGYVTGREVRQDGRPDKVAYSITESAWVPIPHCTGLSSRSSGPPATLWFARAWPQPAEADFHFSAVSFSSPCGPGSFGLIQSA